MKKNLKDYVSMLKKMPSAGKFSESGPYRWESVDPEVKGERKTLFGICSSCMQRDCATLVHLEDGIVVKVDGNPDAPPNYGTLCAKGYSEIMGLYNPYRIKTPMVRTNPEKGLDIDPMWKEVNWEEAMDLVTERLKKVKENDPRGLVICEGFGNRDTILRSHFLRAFGSPNMVITHGPLCKVHFATSLVHAGAPVAIVDLEYCKYHVTLGRSLGPNFATTSGIRKLAKAVDRGMKLVVVDPRSSFEASKGEWVPIRPGTDLAFLLGMAHVMLHEIQVFDEWFLKHRTSAPYLIGPDGYYHTDTETGKPMIWDASVNSAKPFDAEIKEITLNGRHRINGVECRTAFDIVCEEFKKYTPEWAEDKCTVPAETIRKIARKFVDHAQIGSTIEIDGFEFPFRPVSLNTERNVTNHRGGTYADLTGKIINMLVGNIEVPGGCLSNGPRGPYLAPNEDGVVKPASFIFRNPFKFPPDYISNCEFFPLSYASSHIVAQAIVNPDKYHHGYSCEAWMTHGANMIRKVAQPQVFVEALKKIPFHFNICVYMDEPAIMSDVLLPEHGSMERMRVEVFHIQHQSIDNETSGLHMIQGREPVPPLFNTRHTDDILTELAERLGILKGKGGVYDFLNQDICIWSAEDGLCLTGENQLDLDTAHTLEEIFDKQIRSWRHNKKGWGLADLMATGFLEHRVPRKEFYNYYWVPGNKTRHPFYYNLLKEFGDELRRNLDEYGVSVPGIDDMEKIYELYGPIPRWVENSEFRAPEEFDLWAMNWRTPYHANDANCVLGNPWLAEIHKMDPTDGAVCINPVAAKRKGLKEGDWVTVESRYGKAEGRVHVSPLFHPDAVGISGCYGPKTIHSNPLIGKGPHFNALLSIDERTLDVTAGIDIAPRVKVYKKDNE